jgi:hypothetical protein
MSRAFWELAIGAFLEVDLPAEASQRMPVFGASLSPSLCDFYNRLTIFRLPEIKPLHSRV